MKLSVIHIVEKKYCSPTTSREWCSLIVDDCKWLITESFNFKTEANVCVFSVNLTTDKVGDVVVTKTNIFLEFKYLYVFCSK